MKEQVKKLSEYKINKKKEQLANEFLADINSDTYYKLNDFCRLYNSPCFLCKGNRYVMFPNEYTFEAHDFNDETGRFDHMKEDLDKVENSN